MSTIEKLENSLRNKERKSRYDLKDILRLITYYGFVKRRSKGSHNVYSLRKDDGDEILIYFPVVNGREVKLIYVEQILETISKIKEQTK